MLIQDTENESSGKENLMVYDEIGYMISETSASGDLSDNHICDE